jgi:hypothetical protein
MQRCFHAHFRICRTLLKKKTQLNLTVSTGQFDFGANHPCAASMHAVQNIDDVGVLL